MFGSVGFAAFVYGFLLCPKGDKASTQNVFSEAYSQNNKQLSALKTQIQSLEKAINIIRAVAEESITSVRKRKIVIFS